MSVNRHQPHVLVLPEDDANRQLANGFLQSEGLSIRSIQILEVAGGWKHVLARFRSDHVAAMERFRKRFMILLIDFDDSPGRLDEVRAEIPDGLTDRVFVLGALKEPEDLKKALNKSFEAIGLALAKDCREGSDETWSHALLRHNAPELLRLRERVRPIVFESI